MAMSISMLNEVCISLNNTAVSEIQNGNLISAFRMLSHACQETGKSRRRHPINRCHTDDEAYQYSWVDCSGSLLPIFQKHSKFSEGSASFLWLKFLTIKENYNNSAGAGRRTSAGAGRGIHPGEQQAVVCPCGYTWVLWFNLGIVSALLGTPICKAGRLLLEQSLRLFTSVLNRLEPEPDSKHWYLLQLAVMNNQICVLKDLSRDYEMLNSLVCMGIACSKACKLIDLADYDFFHWVTETHLLESVAVAA